MSSRYGLTVDEAVPLLMLAARIDDETERRQEFRRIASQLRTLGYLDGAEAERDDDHW